MEDSAVLSVVIPAYNEEEMIPKTSQTIDKILKEAGIEHELLFINDGSKDNTWTVIEDEARKNPLVKGVCFSRNFGKESAIFAGLYESKGDCAVVIDCDLQHPPEKIVEMYRLWEQGYEVIEGIKDDRGSESVFHRAAADTFYKWMSRATGVDMSSSSDFKLLDRKVVDSLNAMPERQVFFRALSFWVGFRRAEVRYSVQERTAGESKWSTKALIKYALTNVTSFSAAPLHFITLLGYAMLIVSIIFGVISLVQKFMNVAVEGFTTVNILLLFSASVIMISLGIIGFYIERIYEEIKGRPRYIVSEECGDRDR